MFKEFTAFEYVLIALGTALNDSDKESWEVRLNQGIEALKSKIYLDKPALIAKAKEVYGTPEGRYLVLSCADNLVNAIKGYTLHTPFKVDEASSGLELQSLLMRDIKGMISTGMLNGIYDDDEGSSTELLSLLSNSNELFVNQLYANKGGNFYGLLSEVLTERTGIKFTRKEVKKATVPYFYAGTSAAKKYLGPEILEDYEASYAFLAPGASLLRNTFKELWNSNAVSYAWTMPDHYEVKVPVVNREMKPQTYELEVGGKKVQGKVTFPANVSIEKGKAHTLGLGAHLIHSMDSYVLRELNRRCNHKGKEWLEEVLANISYEVGEEPTNQQVLDCIESFNDSGICSVRVLEFIDKPTKLSKEFYDALMREVASMPEEPFEILNVHDEFMCMHTHVNDLRKCLNYIFGSIYLGYFIEMLGVGIKPLAEPNMQVYEAIINSNYALS